MRLNTPQGRVAFSSCGGQSVEPQGNMNNGPDSAGVLAYSQFDQFLREVLKLPMAVFEGPSFAYSEQAARTCFPQQKKVSLNTFLDTLMSDPSPQCLVWLPLMHRLANVENGTLNYKLEVADRLADEHVLIGLYVNLLQNSPRARLNYKLEVADRLADEHVLIGLYVNLLQNSPRARLAQQQQQHRVPTDFSCPLDANKHQRQLIAELEHKNREILQEIQRLRVQHEQASQPPADKNQQNPTLLAELRLLRQRKDELEQRMSTLQESRRELMVQLEQLMMLLKEEERKLAVSWECA
ncbi:hypothetical protein CRUP_031840, partial [Coryphaenoides rupestris]